MKSYIEYSPSKPKIFKADRWGVVYAVIQGRNRYPNIYWCDSFEDAMFFVHIRSAIIKGVQK